MMHEKKNAVEKNGDRNRNEIARIFHTTRMIFVAFTLVLNKAQAALTSGAEI